MMVVSLMCMLLLFGQAGAAAPRPAATVADFAWLAGTWAGEGLGGQVDEVWSAPAGGTMVGHFRLVKDGKPVFYEILTLVEAEGSVEMRLKHFNPDMTGWEEKANFLTFKLTKLDSTGAYLGPLTIKRTGPDSWDGFLKMNQGGQVREEKFAFRRVR